MICKDNQKKIDSLLRLKSNEDLCVNAIKQVMDQQQDNNKIASVVESKNKPVGELREFIDLLKGLTPRYTAN